MIGLHRQRAGLSLLEYAFACMFDYKVIISREELELLGVRGLDVYTFFWGRGVDLNVCLTFMNCRWVNSVKKQVFYEDQIDLNCNQKNYNLKRFENEIATPD